MPSIKFVLTLKNATQDAGKERILLLHRRTRVRLVFICISIRPADNVKPIDLCTALLQSIFIVEAKFSE